MKTIISILAVLVLLIWVGYQGEQAMYRQGYEAWIKETGNPNSLTFDEWNALRYSYQGRRSTTYIHTRH